MDNHRLCNVVVLGGGSGGLAFAKMAAATYKKSVVLFDYVSPSVPHGTKWGLGGTCVNVGCVPKKLMHYAGKIGDVMRHDGEKYGWENLFKLMTASNEQPLHNWEKLVQTVQNHIKSLNFSYKIGLRCADVKYINAKAKFSQNGDGRTIEYLDSQGQQQFVEAEDVVIATGGRPFVPDDVPGARELAITSDDIFSWINKDLGKVLIVGASYIALETAGFLTGLGYDVTVAVRSILLRGFDQQCATKIGFLMQEHGTKFLWKATPESLIRHETNGIEVRFKNNFEGNPYYFDTVIYATGRRPEVSSIGVENTNIELDAVSQKVICNEMDLTSVPHIYAIGDVVHMRPELTPVAIKAGELLADRLYGNSKKMMNYEHIPTTIFTPIEYGCCGFSEEAAIAIYGEENIEVFLSEFHSLEAAASHREKSDTTRAHDLDVDMQPDCFAKLVCLKTDDLRVVGFHFISPNAGEATQGMALSLVLGAKKRDFDNMVGIHPTNVEAFMGLNVTKSSGESWVAKGGCGGGKCG